MKKRLLSTILAILLLSCILAVHAAAQESEAVFMAGYAKEELIAAGDTTEYVLTGSGKNTGANDPICVTCIAMRDHNGKTVLLLSADFSSISQEVGQKVRQRVSSATGVAQENILISATHTHSCLEMNATYGITYQLKNKLYEKAAAAAQAAIEDLSAATVSVGSIDVTDENGEPMNFIRHAYRADGIAAGDNHRKEGAKSVLYGYQGMNGQYCSQVDTTMHLLQFEFEDKQPIVLANWRAHATVFSAGGSDKISADFIGSFRDQMAADGYRAVYFQGAAGDVNPRDIIRQVNDQDSYVAPERVAYGQALAANAKTLLTGDNMQAVAPGALRTATASYTPNARTAFNNVSASKTDAEVYAKAQEVVSDGSAAWADHWYTCEKDYGIYSLQHARAIVNLFNSDGTPKNTTCDPIALSSFSIGDEIAIFGVPGEMFTATSVAIEAACAEAGFQKTFILGYANSQAGYLPTAAAYEYGCYEADTSKYASGVAEGVQAALIGSLDTLSQYCECGGAAEGVGNHQCQALAWTQWTEDSTLPTTAGNYKLMTDVTLSAPYTPAGEVHLDLNGHTIQKASPRVIVVNGHDLTITDTSPERSGTIKLNRTTVYATGNNGGIVWVQSGKFTLYGGTVDGSMVKVTSERGGAAVNVSPGQNFAMYGGTVSGGEATYYGGVVSTLGSVNMYGGTIRGGKAANGGNVAVLTSSGARGLLRIYGGTIENGTATAAGGNIAVIGAAYSAENTKQGEVYILGGTVSGGNAASGGNLAILGAEAEISGGQIAGGNASSDGGNILAEGAYDTTYTTKLAATVSITGGTITGGTAAHGGNLSVRGAYTEKNNTATVQPGSATVTLSGGTITAGEATGTYGGNIQVGSGAVLNLNGGSVTDGTTAGHGGNIAVNKHGYDADGALTYSWAAGGTLNISGDALISRGKATKNAGNILLFGAMKMTGGTIADGTTGSYGVNMRVDSGSSMNLSGGQIAGGVYVNNSNAITLSGKIQILASLTSEGFTAKEGLRLQSTFTDSKKLNISGLTNGARVEILMSANTGAFAALPETMPEGMNADAYAGFFIPTNTDYSATVDAENNTLNLTAGHIHCECGGAAAGMSGHTCQLVTWTAKSGWIGDNTLTEGGYYYLSGDSSGIRVGSASAAKNVHLCLNDHTMNNTADAQRTVMIYGAGSLTVCDHKNTGVLSGTSTSITEGTVVWMNNADGCFTLYGGNLYAGEGTTGLNRGGIVGYYGTMNMYGGTVTGVDLTASGTTADNGWGGAVLVNSLNMYGGTIHGSDAINGGAVVVRSGMHMSGGVINGGTTSYGAAVYASGAKNMVMTGGTINGGTASNNGGAIMLAGASNMTVSGGTVNGGMCIRGGAFMVNGASTKLTIDGATVNGGNVSGNGGAVFVNGNGQVYVKSGLVQNGNIYVSGGKLFPSGGRIEETVIHSLTYASDFTVSGAPILESVVLKVADSEKDMFTVGELTEGAQIIFDLEASGYANADPFAVVSGNGEYAQYFTSGGQLMAAQANGTLYWVDSPIAAYNTQGIYTENALSTITEDVQLTLAKDLDMPMTVNAQLQLDLNGKTVSGPITGTGTVYLADSATGGKLSGTVDVQLPALSAVDGKNYLVVSENGVYTAHGYEVKLTHISLDPSNDALGYKAEFVGDDVAKAHVRSIGFNLWIHEDHVLTKSVNGKTSATLRLKNILAAGGGETVINGNAFVTFDTEDVSTSDEYAVTMKQTLQMVNEAWDSYSEVQQAAVKALCDQYAVTKDWELSNIYPEV